MNAAGWSALLVTVILVGLGALAWVRAEGDSPELAAPEALIVGSRGAGFDLATGDPGSGLRSLRVVFTHAGGELTLLDETYPGNLMSGGVRKEHEARIELVASRLEGVRGAASIQISVRDYSWRDTFSGNETLVEIPVTVDLEPPRVSVLSGLTYVTQGGSGAVAYDLSEVPAHDGVRIGDQVYSGFPRPGGRPNQRVALFAVPAPGDAKLPLRVFAVDPAGNEGEGRWPVVVKPRDLPASRVRLSQTFLETVVPRLAATNAPPDLSAAFHDVNTRVRQQSEKRVRELIAESSPDPLFRGRLSQLANSKVTSRFGEQRSYWVNGSKISSAIHYGYDLASFAAAPITASGAGRVQFAGELGIYGNCVLVDHGLGLTTLYGHLSRLDVRAGEAVSEGQRLGLSGATGLAGGDHLHFAVLIGDTYVDPLEWWDAKWVTTHVEPNLRPALP